MGNEEGLVRIRVILKPMGMVRSKTVILYNPITRFLNVNRIKVLVFFPNERLIEPRKLNMIIRSLTHFYRIVCGINFNTSYRILRILDKRIFINLGNDISVRITDEINENFPVFFKSIYMME